MQFVCIENDDGDFRQPRAAGRAIPAFACDDFIASVGNLADGQRRNDAVAGDAFRQRRQPVFIKIAPRLIAVRLQGIDVQHGDRAGGLFCRLFAEQFIQTPSESCGF